MTVSKQQYSKEILKTSKTRLAQCDSAFSLVQLPEGLLCNSACFPLPLCVIWFHAKITRINLPFIMNNKKVHWCICVDNVICWPGKTAKTKRSSFIAHIVLPVLQSVGSLIIMIQLFPLDKFLLEIKIKNGFHCLNSVDLNKKTLHSVVSIFWFRQEPNKSLSLSVCLSVCYKFVSSQSAASQQSVSS